MAMTPEERKAKHAAYMREWNAKNREKVLARRRERHPLKREARRKWVARNREKIRERERRYRAANLEKAHERQRRNRATKPSRWRPRDPAKVRAYRQAYKAKKAQIALMQTEMELRRRLEDDGN